LVQAGRPAPDFTLRDQHGAPVTLSAYEGTQAVVVMFYPYAFSRVCTGELALVRESLPTFESEAVQVLGVSCDPVFTLRAFADQERLSFPLLSDFWPHGDTARAYGVFDQDRGCAQRATFIVDRAGVVRWTVLNAMADPRDLQEQARVLAAL
jgi:peroxiredoxin